jgi:beta-galactosidase/beta-glucuronidase
MKHCFLHAAVISLLALSIGPAVRADWAPVEGQLMTRWAKEVTPDHALPEYPRPQMVRREWQNLNGLWDYAIVAKDAARPDSFQGQILVPFPVQSALSGVKKTLSPDDSLWYRRQFSLPAAWAGRHVLLNFGAVDWQATIWVNGVNVGEHKGGFDPFSIDITPALKPDADQEIVVQVWDPNDRGSIPRGKQVLRPSGIMYTAVSGIWQTVWIEPVAEASIASLKITPDLDASTVSVTANGAGTHFSDVALVEILEGDRTVAKAQGPVDRRIDLKVRKPKTWSPKSPFLYSLKVTLARNGKILDSVDSYFGMRKVEIKKDAQGLNRIYLNGQALFEMGPLDQGWWPDGLYTAPTDDALKFDIEEMLRMGFNMARKHVKVEPDRWYYWADKLGLLIWQDMPSGDRPIRNTPERRRRNNGRERPETLLAGEAYEIYAREFRAMIDTHYNHPSIVMWVPFNEGWGEFDPVRIASWTRQMDPTRLVNNASGWTDAGAGDVSDRHDYPGPGMNPVEDLRASVLGEFGGLGLPMPGHLWVERGAWGYQNMTNAGDLTRHYDILINALKGYEAHGLAAAVYTQLTDCETEVNGLLTYDRNVNKMGAQQLSQINIPLYSVPSNTNAPIPVVPKPPRRNNN